MCPEVVFWDVFLFEKQCTVNKKQKKTWPFGCKGSFEGGNSLKPLEDLVFVSQRNPQR